MKLLYFRSIAVVLLFSASLSWAEPKNAAPAKEAKPEQATTAPAAEATGPETAADFQKAGDLAMKKGKVEDAVAAYKQCLEKAGDDPAFDKVALAVGRHYNKTGDFKVRETKNRGAGLDCVHNMISDAAKWVSAL